MVDPTADVALLTRVPQQHLESGLQRCAETGFVAFGTESGMVLSEFRMVVDDDHPADILFYASETSKAGPPSATYRGRFTGYDGAVDGRAKKAWAQHRPPTTEHDGAWQSFYLVKRPAEARDRDPAYDAEQARQQGQGSQDVRAARPADHRHAFLMNPFMVWGL